MTVALDVGPLRPNPTGVGIYVRSLALAMSEIGRDDIVYIGRRGDAEGLPASVDALSRPARMPYSMWVQLAGRRDARRSGAAVAHFTDGLVPLVRSGPTVLTVLDLSLVREWRSHRFVRYARIPLVLAAPRLASRVIAISQATADEVVRLTRTPARMIDVIPLAARASARPMPHEAVENTLSRWGLARGAYLLVPGTIEPRKNHVRVVRAFEQLASDGELPLEMQLVLAGGSGWRSDHVLAAIAASPVRHRIKLLGYVGDDEMASLMTGSGAVVYVSTYEGFGLPVLEAMACGAIVVTSNVSSMPEAAGGAGILVDPHDPFAIASGILDALQGNGAMRESSLSRAARAQWSLVARQTAAVYDDAL